MKTKTTCVCELCGKEYSHPYKIKAECDCSLHEELCCLEKVNNLINKFKPFFVLYIVTWTDKENGNCEKLFWNRSDAEKFHKSLDVSTDPDLIPMSVHYSI